MSENLLHINIIVPERKILSADIHAVTIPAMEGEMTILPHHAPAITQLRPVGFITIQHENQKQENIIVRQGFAEITGEKVTVLAQEAVGENENPKEHIRQWIEDAEKSDNKIQNGIDIPDALKRLHERM